MHDGMIKRSLRHLDILDARKAYREGRNLTQHLRSQFGVQENTPAIIEASYDLQAGSYIDAVRRNPDHAHRYAAEIATLLRGHLEARDTLLDIGTGEITTFSLVVQQLGADLEQLYAFDISLSRILKGLEFARANMPDFARLTAFVGDIGEIPLRDKSVSVVTSSHALEPNGGNLEALLRELFRVTRKKLVLFEPCYEINSDEGKQRMDRFGYIKNLAAVAERLGGRVIEQRPLVNVANPLNPTVCYTIEIPEGPDHPAPAGVFSVPGTDYPLLPGDGFYLSDHTGLCFPTIRGVPVLRSSAAILASALVTDRA